MIKVLLMGITLFASLNTIVQAAFSLPNISSPAIPSRSYQGNSPLNSAQIEQLVKNEAPDNAIAVEIERRGLTFQPDAKILERLQKLGAGPKTIEALKESRIRLSIVSVSRLSPKSGVGLGYEVLLKNDYLEEVFVASTKITGIYEVNYRSLTTVIHRVVYEVELDSAIPDPKSAIGSQILNGKVYDSSSLEWGIHCHGIFRFDVSASNGHKLWEYSFSVPSVAQIPSGDRVFLRILFKRGIRRIIEEKSEDSTGASFEGSIIKNDHRLIIKFDGGQTLEAPIDDGFFKLVANWDN